MFQRMPFILFLQLYVSLIQTKRMYSSLKLGRILFRVDTTLKFRCINRLYFASPSKLLQHSALNKQSIYVGSLDKFAQRAQTNVYATFFRSSSQNSPKKYQHEKASTAHKNGMWYILSGFVIMIGVAYAGVPLFKIFCESQGIEANVDFRDVNFEKLKDRLATMKKDDTRVIKVKFVASTSADLLWKFQPCQDEIKLVPGETALAFFKAKNLTDRSIVGIGELK